MEPQGIPFRVGTQERKGGLTMTISGDGSTSRFPSSPGRDLAVEEGMTIVLTTRDLMASRAAAHPGGPELVRFS